MCDHTDDTGEFLAVHYPNLDGPVMRRWLRAINDRIGWLKQNFSGNAMMQVSWRGGLPGKPEWSIKLKDSPEKIN